MNMKRISNHSRQGFTLIEVLIVVVIIGLLVAVGVQKLGAAKERGQAVAARAMVTQINKGIQLMILDDSSNPSPTTITNIQTAIAALSTKGYYDQNTIASWTDLSTRALTFQVPITFSVSNSGTLNVYVTTNASSDGSIVARGQGV